MERWTLHNFRTGGGVKDEVTGEKGVGRPAWQNPEQEAVSQEAPAGYAFLPMAISSGIPELLQETACGSFRPT